MTTLRPQETERIGIRLAVRVLVAVAAATAIAACAWAGSSQRTGTNGAHELRLPVGPRGSALGGTVIGDVRGIEAMFWNPAGLGTLEGTEAMFSNTSYFADMKLNYAAVATRLGNFGTLGFSAKVLSIGDVIVTTEDAPEGTGEILRPTFTVLGAAWGRQFTDRVNFGLTAQYVNEHIAQATAQGVAFDFGVQYDALRGLRLGLSMKNFGTSMEFGGAGFESSLQPPGSEPSASSRVFRATSASFEMPSYFTLAMAYDLKTDARYRLTTYGAFQNNNFSDDNVRGAVEMNFRETYALRASYFASFGSSTDLNGNETNTEFDSGDDLYSGFALGAGAQIKTGEKGRIGIDLAWRPVREFFDDTIELGVKLSF